MNKLKEFLPLIIKGVNLLFVVLALIFMLALPCLERSEEGATVSVAMFSLVFGNGSMHTVAGPMSADVSYNGGMSFFALAAFLLLVVGVVAFVLSFVLKEKARLCLLVAGALFVVSGILAFLVKTAGTDVTMSVGPVSASESFADAFSELNLGVGAILFGVFNVLGGCLLLVNELVLNKNK